MDGVERKSPQKSWLRTSHSVYAAPARPGFLTTYDLGPVEHHQQLGLVGAQAGDDRVELGKTSHPAEDPLEPCAQGSPPGRRRLVLVELQVGVEPPHQLALQVEQPLLLRGHADQPAKMALGMDPA